MKSSMRTQVARRVLMGVTLAAALLARSEFAAVAQSSEPFKIGAVGSLTGPAAGFGKDYMEGFVAYVKAWNERGGINGRKVLLEQLDDETNPVSAINAFRRLAADPSITVIWLGISSNSALGIKAISSESKIPIVSGGAVDSLGIPPAPYFFKVAPGTNDFMAALVTFAQKKGFKKIATINATDAYGQSEARYLKESAEKAGIAVVVTSTFGVSDTNFNAQLVNIRSANADMVYSGAVGGPAILIFKQYKQLGIATPLALSQGALNQSFFAAIADKSQLDGILVPTNHGTLAEEIGGKAGEIYAELTKALGKKGTLFHVFGWDHGIITEWAVKNSDGTRDGIRIALEKAKDVAGINGPMTFTPESHIGNDYRGLVIARFKGGKFVIAD